LYLVNLITFICRPFNLRIYVSSSLRVSPSSESSKPTYFQIYRGTLNSIHTYNSSPRDNRAGPQGFTIFKLHNLSVDQLQYRLPQGYPRVLLAKITDLGPVGRSSHGTLRAGKTRLSISRWRSDFIPRSHVSSHLPASKQARIKRQHKKHLENRHLAK